MTGSLDEPKVSVNPLAVLAPGFLRTLFNVLFEGEPGPAPEQAEHEKGYYPALPR